MEMSKNISTIWRKLSGRSETQFVRNASELDMIDSGKPVVIYGDAVFAEFREGVTGLAKDNVEQVRAGYRVQPARYPNDNAGSLFAKKKDVLSVQVEKTLIDGLSDRKAVFVCLAHDAVISWVKKTYGKKRVVVYVCNHIPEQRMYLVEVWEFNAGKLKHLDEVNIDDGMHTDVIRSLAERISRDRSEIGNESTKYVLTGIHGLDFEGLSRMFTILGLNEVQSHEMAALCEDRRHEDRGGKKIFVEHDNLSILDYTRLKPVGRPVELKDKGSLYELALPAGILAAGIAAFGGLNMYGKSRYANAVDEYHVAVSAIQDIYSKGSTPIQLLQQRQYYMEMLEQAPATISRDTERALRAVSGLRKELIKYNPLFLAYQYDKNQQIQSAGGQSNYQFSLTVSFSVPDKNELLAIGKMVQASLSKHLGTGTQSDSLPRKLADSEESNRYAITVVGKFDG